MLCDHATSLQQAGGKGEMRQVTSEPWVEWDNVPTAPQSGCPAEMVREYN